MLNRAEAPLLQLDTPIQLAPYTRLQLGQLPVYAVGGGLQEITKLELVYVAGKWNEPQKGAAYYAARLLKEGTAHRDAENIAHQLDYWGASIAVESSADYWTVTAYALTKHLPDMVALLRELLTTATFPEEELALQQHLQLQKLKVDQQKVAYRATKQLMGLLFGPDHFYGYRLSPDMIEQVSRDSIAQFYNSHIVNQAPLVFVSGFIPADFTAIWEKAWPESLALPPGTTRDFSRLPAMATQGTHRIHMPGTQQSALRIGRLMPHHTHADYLPLKVLNTVLGGYFGSRLMGNIREDKGYTYGIYAVLHAYAQQGVFYISTEVGAAVEKAALQEIYHELDRLQNEPIPAEELTLVRNYLLGNILGGIDGPMKAANTIKGLILQGQDEQVFMRFIDTIRTVTPAQLQALAQQYWQPDDLTVVIAGPNTTA